MYGPPPDCKGFEVDRSNSLRKCIRPLSGERFLRALNDDPRVSVLINGSVTRDAYTTVGFSDTPLDCYFVFFLSLADLGGNLVQKPPSWRWDSGKRSLLSKRSVFSTAIMLPQAAGTDVDTVCHSTTPPRPCERVY